MSALIQLRTAAIPGKQTSVQRQGITAVAARVAFLKVKWKECQAAE
jgi:hypothetical protein